MKTFLLLLATIAGLSRAQTPPVVGDTFQFSPEFPKYVTAHIEFRDPTEQRWPSIFYGKPAASGNISIATANPTAAFTLSCDERPQKNGDQSRRVLGEIFAVNTKGGVALDVSRMGPIVAKQAELETSFIGTLKLPGKTLAITAPARLRVHAGGRGDEKNNALMGDLSFEIKAADLGLKSFAAESVIQVKASFTAYPPGSGQRRR